MPHVNPTLPNDGENADAEDISVPFLALLAIFNGHIAGDNIEPGSLPWSVMDDFLGAIPAGAMEDSANLEKYRDENNIGFVASGLVWSDVSGFNGAMTAGVAYTANGKRHSISAVASRAFTASKDTYIDVLSTGSIDYQEVANGATQPALPTDGLRIAKVVTNGSEITGVTDLRKTPDSPRSYHGSFNNTTTPQVIANLPFKPNLVMFFFAPNPGTNDRLYIANGIAFRPTSAQHSWSATTDGATGRRDRSTSKAIQAYAKNTNALVAEGTVSAWADDGFTVTMTTATSGSDMIEWVAFP